MNRGEEDDQDEALDPDPGAPVPSAAAPWLDRAGNPVDMGLRSHLDEHGQPRVVERHFTVADEHAGARLDHYLKRMIPRLSRTRVQAVIRDQLTRVPDAPHGLKPATAVVAGDHYVIRRAARAEPPCPRHVEVLHEDAHILVVDKPPGLPCHASAKFYFNTLTRVLFERFGPDLQICHRLDRETSGALVVAKDPATAALVKGAFERKRVAKTYLAIVHGAPPWEQLALTYPLALARPGDPSRLPDVRMLIRPIEDGGLPSETIADVVARTSRYALVRCTPITGRQHQIRAHLAAAGFPIVGDKLYAHGEDAFMSYCDRGLTPELAALFELPRHALHAASVTFPHPTRGERFRVDSPLARDLDDFFRARA